LSSCNFVPYIIAQNRVRSSSLCISTLEDSSKVYFAFFLSCISFSKSFRSLQRFLEFLKENEKWKTGAQCWAGHSAQGLAGSAMPSMEPAHDLSAGVRSPGALAARSLRAVRTRWRACRQCSADEHRESSEEAPGMVVARGTHPLGSATMRVEATMYVGIRWCRVGSSGR
jgi:hypothetical protein